ncbi:MAG: GNAT family N-acetyltransferase [Muribaculaceae bacterium]|nr:GNAT family N-acetyltransferase [Muribaculaceae bacterium]
MYIRPYTPADASEWDQFVSNSRNATFILRRSFMDYHADRFQDASLMLYDDKNALLALLPASMADGVVSSHAGLTYGGWILGRTRPNVLQLLEAWGLMADYYRSLGCHTLLYKAIPHIYNKYPSEEDQYVLFRNNAVIESVLASSVIDLTSPIHFNKGSRRHVNKIEGKGYEVSMSDDLEAFWLILESRLSERYGARPVHSLDEIRLLKGRFPENIVLWMIADPAGRILGGTVLFVDSPVVKSQYIASTAAGREVNALDYLFSILIEKYSQQRYRYFDLGPSCEDGGRILNEGLAIQKIGYGGRCIAYNTYRVKL